MALSKNNILTRGLSGKIGDLLVFRQYGDKTVVSHVPKMPTVATEQQKASRKRFQQAMFYAKQAMTDPDMKAAYKDAARKGQTAYNVAVADFLHAPEIQLIDLASYTGNAGDAIRIQVTDDFLVKEVKVEIIASDGTLLESGDTLPDATGNLWTYLVGIDNPDLHGCRVVVTAFDFPGNSDVKEKLIQMD